MRMIRLCDAAVEAGNFGSAYRRVLALFFPRTEPPRRTVLSGVTLQLTRGSALGVLGDAEALLRLAAGEADCAAGTAERRGRIVRASAGMLLPFLSGRGNARLFARLHGLSRREARDTAREAQAIYEETAALLPPPATKREARAWRFCGAVSGYAPDRRAALAVALALAQEPDALLLHACLARLSPAAVAAAAARIRARLAGGMCLLAAEPQEILALLCPRAIWIEQGEVRDIGPLQRVAAARRAACSRRPLCVYTGAMRAARRARGRVATDAQPGEPPPVTVVDAKVGELPLAATEHRAAARRARRADAPDKNTGRVRPADAPHGKGGEAQPAAAPHRKGGEAQPADAGGAKPGGPGNGGEAAD